MTLGCGGWGGNITSDNISPRHLLNIKRLAWETSPAPVSPRPEAIASARSEGPASLPKVAATPPPAGIAAASLARRIDEFLTSRGYAAPAPAAPKGITAPLSPTPTPVTEQAATVERGTVEKAADFVCEEDVRLAVRQGRKIVIGERTIVTPAARDLAEQHRVFVQAGWRT